MGNPVKQYCSVFVCDPLGTVLYDITIHDANTGDVLIRSNGTRFYNDYRLREWAEERTGKTCLEVIRE